MSDDRFCVLCSVYRPDADPRLPEDPASQVCNGHQRRLAAELTDIDRLHHMLLNPDPTERDDRTYDAQYRQWDETAKAWVAHSERRRADPVAAIGGVAPIRARSGQPVVSGSRARAVPVDVDVIDLTAPSRLGSVRDTMIPLTVPERVVVHSRRIVAGEHGPTVQRTEYPVLASRRVLDDDGKPVLVAAGDQIGQLSAATILDGWVREWRAELWPYLTLPEATVPVMVAWMLTGNRIREACGSLPLIAECAEELRDLRLALRGAADETDPQPKLHWGVRCMRCNTINQLFEPTPPLPHEPRRPGDDYIECGSCGLLYTQTELAEWRTTLAEQEREQRSSEEIRQLMSGRRA